MGRRVRDDRGVVVPRAAALLERTVALAQAQAALAESELALLRADPAKRGDAERQVQGARDALAAAEKARESPGDTYTPIAGALKTFESNLESEGSRRKPFPATSTGRRRALAAWMTDRRNPLAARVAVHHVWARHFGRPLVPTVFDFGEFDIAEFYTGEYLADLADRRLGLTAIPIFVKRMFRHSYIYVNKRAGIRSPRLPYCNESNASTWVVAASSSEINFCALPRKNA